MKKSLIDHYQTRDYDYHIPGYDVRSESQKYPTAVFIMAKCTSSNPLRIMHAESYQLDEHISEISLYDRKSRTWEPKTDEFAHEIPTYRLRKMSIRYVHILDKQQNMVFCIDL